MEILPSSMSFVVVVRPRRGEGGTKKETRSKTEREKEGTQDCEIVIIAYTNEKLITLQLPAQTVLLQTEHRGHHAASVRFGGS